MLRFTTAGESHGPALIAILERRPRWPPSPRRGHQHPARPPPTGLRPRPAYADRDGSGRVSIGGTGWRDARLSNRTSDPEPGLEKLAGDHERRPDGGRPGTPEARRHPPPPGHADLTGMLKYDRTDARDILERASARETTARVAAGAICRKLLSCFGIQIGSHLTELGGITATRPEPFPARSERRGRPLPLSVPSTPQPKRG